MPGIKVFTLNEGIDKEIFEIMFYQIGNKITTMLEWLTKIFPDLNSVEKLRV